MEKAAVKDNKRNEVLYLFEKMLHGRKYFLIKNVHHLLVDNKTNAL